MKEIGAITSTQQLFYNFRKLQSVPLFDTSSVVSFYRMFYGCILYTESPAFDLSAATRVDRMFELTSVEKVNTMNYSTVGNVTYHFVNLYAFTSPTTMTLTAATSLSFLFSGCIGIRSIELLDLGNITTTVSCFNQCYSLVSLIVEGITVGFSVANCNMPATALNAMFTSLGTANGVQAITITGNDGAATCDQTIATAKGYTIVN